MPPLPQPLSLSASQVAATGWSEMTSKNEHTHIVTQLLPSLPVTPPPRSFIEDERDENRQQLVHIP